MIITENYTPMGSVYYIFQDEIFLSWGIPCPTGEFVTPKELAMCKEYYIVPLTKERVKFLSSTTETNYQALRNAMLNKNKAEEMEALTLQWEREYEEYCQSLEL